jgi:hypothetical protein
MKTILVAACLAAAAWTVSGCDATSGGLRVENQSPFPYNSRW